MTKVSAEFEMIPDFAVYEGRHEFDGKLPDWSAAGLSRTIASYLGMLGHHQPPGWPMPLLSVTKYSMRARS